MCVPRRWPPCRSAEPGCGLGGGFVVLSLALRLTPRGKARLASTASKRLFGAYIGWIYPLFTGLGLLFGKLPRLLGAPYAAVMVFDTVGLLLAIALGVLMIRAALRLRAG
jgi:hypothetical protein